MNVTSCYPDCGIPAIVHVHGLETPAEYDGLPIYSFGKGKSKKDYYTNAQPGATLLYHDHSLGLTRLNIWAGLLGVYVIEDTTGIDSSIRVDCDIPLLIQDKILATDGSILYPDAECPVSSSQWVPEGYGSVNVVNGVAFPFVKIPKEQCRLRLINAASARRYILDIPFADQCKIIAKDSAYLKQPQSIPKTVITTSLDPCDEPETDGDLVLFPYERVDLFCDFRNMTVGSAYNVSNLYDEDGAAYELLQVRIVASSNPPKPTVTIPTTLNPIKDLRALWKSSGGKTRNITLQELPNPEDPDCPMTLRIIAGGKHKDFVKDEYIPCEIGKVERWNFRNPTEDFHPFHWHLVHAQCGPTEDTPNINELRDVYPIPPASPSGSWEITQVCYVACTPGSYLVKNSTVAATDFAYDVTAKPYLVHCHILEHEENMMMTWFRPVKSTVKTLARDVYPFAASKTVNDDNV